MNKKFSLTLLGLMLLPFTQSVYAYQVSEQNALEAARYFFAEHNSSSKVKRMPAAKSLELSYKSSSDDGKTFYYVFNKGSNEGFVIISGDDSTESVLGYSDSGSFEYDKIPDAMKWLLGEYVTEISNSLANPYLAQVNKARKKAVVTKANISPLLTATWDQGEPYNKLCPLHSGKPTYTGCVATAMAQIMHFHRWPEKGTGKNSYTYKYYENSNLSGTLTRDFSNSTYDWEEMLDSYSGSYTSTQSQAVAKLMSDVGISVDMRYGTNASGAVTSKTSTALAKYFGYSTSAKYVSREYYSAQEWNQMIYDELSAKRPVLYGGQGGGGGHAFVCDGYAQGDYFHINWGWSGSSNGYFLLSALNPSTLGTGGGTGGFNYTQGAVIGIQRKTNDDEVEEDFVSIDWNGPFKADISTNGLVNFYAFENDGGLCFVNNSKTTIAKVEVGIRIVGNNVDKYVTGYSLSNFPPGYGYFKMGVPLYKFGLAAGSYTVTPAYCVDDTWCEMKVPQGVCKSLLLTVSDKNVYSFTENKRDYQIMVEDVERPIAFYTGKKFHSIYSIKNNGAEDFMGYIYLNMRSSDDSNSAVIAKAHAVIPAGGKSSVDFVGVLENSFVGSCNISLTDVNNDPVGNSEVSVDVKNVKMTNNLEISNFKVTNTDFMSIECSVDLKGIGGTFIGPFSACLYYVVGSYGYYLCADDKDVCVDSEKSTTFKFRIANIGASCLNKPLYFRLYYNGDYHYDGQRFTATETPKQDAKNLVVNSIGMCDATQAKKSARVLAVSTTRDVLIGVKLTAENGYDGTVKLLIKGENGEEVASNSVNIAMEVGETFKLDQKFEGLNAYETYTCVVTDGTLSSTAVRTSDNKIAETKFVIDKLIHLEMDVITDNTLKRFEVYTIAGNKVLTTSNEEDIQSLNSGIYIVRTISSGNIEVKKIIVD